LSALLTYIDKYSQGHDIAIPLIGGGQFTRMDKTPKDILETMIMIFKHHHDKLNCNIHIILMDKMRETVSLF
jgi:hypothetical protein